MKQQAKYFLFSNFKNNISKAVTKNELSLNTIENMTAQNNVIEPLCEFEVFVKQIIPEENYNYFYFNNASLLNNTLKLEIYEYYDSTENSFKNRLFAIDKNYELYEYNHNTYAFTNCYITFSIFPNILFCDGNLYFIDNNNTAVMIEEGNSPIVLTSIAKINQTCTCEDKLFFSTIENHFEIFYTDKTPLFNIHSNLENCYSISLLHEDGKLLSIINLNEKLYVVQQYKISKITLKNDEPLLSDMVTIDSHVYEKTIQTCEDMLIFSTKTSLFAFNGNSCTKLFDNIFQSFEHKNPSASICNGNYFLKINDAVLIEFNIENRAYNFFKLSGMQNIYSLKSVNFHNLCLLCFNESKYSVLTISNNETNTLNKKVLFNKITFDLSEFKVLKELKFIGIGECDVTIQTDIESNTFHLTSNTKMPNIAVHGHLFEFQFESVNEFSIDALFVKILVQSDEYE